MNPDRMVSRAYRAQMEPKELEEDRAQGDSGEHQGNRDPRDLQENVVNLAIQLPDKYVRALVVHPRVQAAPDQDLLRRRLRKNRLKEGNDDQLYPRRCKFWTVSPSFPRRCMMWNTVTIHGISLPKLVEIFSCVTLVLDSKMANMISTPMVDLQMTRSLYTVILPTKLLASGLK